MSIFSPSSRQALKPHAHAADEACPWCEQPISHGKFEEIKRRMVAQQNERLAQFTQQVERDKAAAEAKAKTALDQARAEAAAAGEQKVAAARNEIKAQAEAAALAKLADIQEGAVANRAGNKVAIESVGSRVADRHAIHLELGAEKTAS